MKFNIKIILSSILLIIALLIVIWKISSKNPPSESSKSDTMTTTKHERASGGSHASQDGKQQSTRTAERSETDQNKSTQAPNKEFILDKIQSASTTYDASQLPNIKPYLLDANPEIRNAAVNGMIVLGNAAASPMLREAAKQMNTAEDMKIMLEAAEYLDLPPANLKEILNLSKKKKVTPPEVPSEQNQIK